MENVYQVQFSFYESFKELRVLFKIVSEWQNITILIFVIFWYPEFTFHHHHLPFDLDQDIRYSPKMNKSEILEKYSQIRYLVQHCHESIFSGKTSPDRIEEQIEIAE